MKKYILTMFLAAAAGALSASAQNVELKSLPDSLSFYIGDTEGGFTLLNSSKAADPKAMVDAYKSAVEYVFALPEDYLPYAGEALKRAVEMRAILVDMKRNGVDVDPKLYLDAFYAAIDAPQRDEAQMNQRRETTHRLLGDAVKVIQKNKEAERQRIAAENKVKGAEFIANAKKADKKIKTTKSGLAYKCVAQGKGGSPKPTDRVKVHYTGRLTDGKVFDSSVERGEPATFGVSQLIKGFTEGLLMMKPGAKYTFYIPSDLAYGDQGSGDVIAPGSTLIFDVELLEIEPEKK